MKEKASISCLFGIILLIGSSIEQDEERPSILQIFLAKITREPSTALKGDILYTLISIWKFWSI